MVALKRDAVGWMRDVAVTAIVVTLGFVALAAVTGRAYASLPGIDPQARPAASSIPEATSPHGPEPACAACHRAHTAIEGSLLTAAEADSSICTRCHKTGGATEVSAHSNMDFIGAAQASFYVSCAACHDPHGDPNASGGNRAMVRTSIVGLAVNLHALSGPDSFDDGMDDGQHDSICVVCHTTTSHNAVTSPELADQGHNPVGTDCTSCHKHGGSATSRSGFMPDAPPTPTPSPSPPPTDTPTPAPAPTDTAQPATDTPTPVATDTPTPTNTPDPGVTDTPTATPQVSNGARDAPGSLAIAGYGRHGATPRGTPAAWSEQGSEELL